MLRWLPALLLALLLIFLAARQFTAPIPESDVTLAPGLPPIFDPAFIRMRPTLVASTPYITRLTAALGAESGALTYNAQPFLIDRHLGDDLNGIGGWNSDLKDPVFAIGNGLVTYAGTPAPGWGKSVTLAHRNDSADPTAVIQSFYSHLFSSDVSVGDAVATGHAIGKVGTANGRYLAHLHLELRKGTASDAGAGYNTSPLNRISPSLFLEGKGQPQPERSLYPSILNVMKNTDKAGLPVTISSEAPPTDAGQDATESATREPRQ